MSLNNLLGASTCCDTESAYRLSVAEMPGKKNSKLSLKRSDNKVNDVKTLLTPGYVNLDETCEFQQAPVFSRGCGDAKIKPEKLNEDGTESAQSAAAEVACLVCNKSLSHMNVQRRQQHVNRCIDKVESCDRLQKQEEHMLESARRAVLNCPMCGKRFKTGNARMGHLKRCAQDVGISTEKMLQLVKEQEDERNTQVAAGIIPQELKALVSKQKGPKKKRIKEPGNQFEEDVQVAMAMSSSLATDSDHIGAQSERDGEKRRKKNIPRMEDVCLLTTLSDTDRKRRMEEKVSCILQSINVSDNTYMSRALSESSLKADNKQKRTSLWEKCSWDPGLCDNDMFYVGALVPPLRVSTLKPGASLRRMSSIPGREQSFVSASLEKVSNSMSSVAKDDVIAASTQTAVVLAELAVDSADISQIYVTSQKSSNFIDLQASGFCVEKLVLPV